MNAKKRDAQEMAEWMAQLTDHYNSKWIGTYILDENHQPVKADTLTWARWHEDWDNRSVKQTYTEHYHISTVCLGIDHGWGKGRPVLFETMVFGKNVVSIKTRQGSGIEHDQERYCTWEEAEKGHDQMVRRVLEFEQGQSSQEKDA